jgi:hypothetical protein
MIFWLSKRESRKSLSYEVHVTDVTRTRAGFADLSVTFRGIPVSDPSIVAITFKNDGRAPIRANDFESHLFVQFENEIIGEQLIAHHVSYRDPETLSPQTYSSSRPTPGIEIEPLLLNPGDEFTIVALVADYGNGLSVRGRIAGVKHIQKRRRDKTSLSFAASIFSLLSLALMVWASIKYNGTNWGWNVKPRFWDYATGFVASIAAFMWFAEVLRKFWRVSLYRRLFLKL